MSDPIDLAVAPPFRLGPLLVEPAGLRVRAVDAREEAVEPRVMQVLVVLVEAAGEVVSREELTRRCWNNRIVGDDAINRVIGRLRRIAAGLAGGSFAIETVTKVGYRLVSTEPVPAEPAMLAEPPAKATRRRLPYYLAAALLVLLTAGAILLWRFAPPADDDRPSVAIADFAALDGTSRGAAQAMREELRTAFQNEAVQIDGGADFSVAGTVRKVGPDLRVVARLDDVKHGRTVWSGAQQVPGGDPGALTGAMKDLGDTIACGLQAARSRSPRLSGAQIGLYFTYCEGYTPTEPGKALTAVRTLTRDVPDFAPGWLGIATIAGSILFVKEDGAVRAEGLAAAQKAVALLPGKGDGYAFEAVLLAPSQPVARERLLRHAAPLDWINCRCARDFLGDFLIQSGQFREALATYRDAEDDKVGGVSGGGLLLWRLAMASELSGDRAAADTAFARYEADFGPIEKLRRERAMWRGDWARLASQPPPPEDPLIMPVWHEVVTALATGDDAAKQRAATKLRTLPPGGRERMLAGLLAQLGDADGAFAVLDTSRRANTAFAAPGRYPGFAQPLLWDPTLRPLWRDARFADFLRRAGFIAYWRETKSKPDACAASAPPDFCQAI
jgi:DNA-binding winged helix-turn-helix (wHTH) protein